MLALYWPCEACGCPANDYHAGPFMLAGKLLCAACMDDMGIADPVEDYDPKAWGDRYDKARDREEEASCGLS